MRGVTGEDDAPQAPVPGDQRAEGIGRGPDQLGLRGLKIVGDALPDPVRLVLDLGIFIGTEHEAEPVMVGTKENDRDRLRGIADVGQGAAMLIEKV